MTKCSLTGIVVVIAAGLSLADRSPRPREPDPAELIKGNWVLAAVEHKGIVTPQIETRDERALDWIAHLRYQPENRDKAVDTPPSQVLSPPPAIYQFSGGRLTVWENSRQTGEGKYRFVERARNVIFELKWDKSPSGARNENWNRLLYRNAEETMSWCHDSERPDRPPAQFVASGSDIYILSFRKVK